MPWFKVDDTFPHHAKVLAAGNAAVGLWTRAGAWSMQQLTDGFVPTHVSRTMGTAVEARRLVDVGLWAAVDGGYRFHEWAERQPSREKVQADRNAATERQRHARERAKSQRESRRDSQRESRQSSGVSHGPPDPTRPDPLTDAYASVSAEAGEMDRFEEFWDTYGKKEGRKATEQKWRLALRKPGVTKDRLIDAAASYIAWQVAEGKHPQYTKHAATWLHGEHWTDERASRADPLTNTQRHIALVQKFAAEEAEHQSTILEIGHRP